ncbi:MAG: pyruvate:ferredoxin (flavodoxin) oxidoreductase [Candidatus Cloacimonetes bacterium]|nr:pyruvate:ferredoxin (flavodoxin) oxidoreductase [Candidatus Cloacimonadota bacterium]
MSKFKKETMEGNQAATHVAYAFSDVAAIYPITPSSDMGQYADAWAAEGKENMFGKPVDVVEMQSEAGAAGSVHGALAAGALTTTFTASQGLLLMIPNMHKIAGELLPTVFHVSARSLACQSLSIFGDHSDVMSVRNTGFGMIASASVQEIMDLALVAHLASLKTSIPFLHFFDGFRNSHEVSKIEVTDYETMKNMIEPEFINKFKRRAMVPDKPIIKVGAQNPDVYFQGRETVNRFYDDCPQIVQEYMDKVAKVVGRQYNLFDYVGAPDADKVIVCMASGCETVEETIELLNKQGHKLGLVKVRLFRPFSLAHFEKAIPSTCKKIAVLDRTKEPGSLGEPLYMDVVTALKNRKDTLIIGGRYGLSSKEFTPSMVKAIYDHLDGEAFHSFTVGIEDDVTHKSLKLPERINAIPEGTISCMFWGLGADGTVGANKNSIKIIGDNTDMYAQGYFQYDSKKSGGITRSHLRFGKSKIRSQYLVQSPDFVACHNPAFIGRYDMLSGIKQNGTFLLNSNWDRDEVFFHLTEDMQKIIIDRKIKFFNIDALSISKAIGLGNRINTVMQTAFFLISGVLDRNVAVNMIKDSIKYTYGKRGTEIVEKNWKAVDATNEALVEVPVPDSLPGKAAQRKKLIPDNANDFTKTIMEPIMREEGNQIKVSQMPIDGTMQSGTTALEKRGVSAFVPRWIPENCIQCNQCSIVCPHAAIRPKQIAQDDLKGCPKSFNTIKASGKNDYQYKIQVYIDDCYGCSLCINECPAKEKAILLKPIEEERERGETENYVFFNNLPNDVLGEWKEDSVKGSQFKQPLLEFSGACAGCGETPYVKLITQFYGDRMIIANATGCSSIWGGTFPNIPYCKNKLGHGPTWANSLFEDNAEYGFGMRLAVDANRRYLKAVAEKLAVQSSCSDFKAALKHALENWKKTDNEAILHAEKIKTMIANELKAESNNEVLSLIKQADELKNYFVDKSIWCVGGDGWAYDIGFGGLDHVLATNRNVKMLVMDTEVYSNTGGQASKSTPLGGVARFAEGGKPTTKKDLGLMMMSYGYIYVASVAMGADKNQLIKAIREAEEFDGPAIILAYATCIHHGMDMTKAKQVERNAVASGYWLLYRYNPANIALGKNPFTLDSKEPTKDVREFIDNETRFTSLNRLSPEKMSNYKDESHKFIQNRWKYYKHLAGQ